MESSGIGAWLKALTDSELLALLTASTALMGFVWAVLEFMVGDGRFWPSVVSVLGSMGVFVVAAYVAWRKERRLRTLQYGAKEWREIEAEFRSVGADAVAYWDREVTSDTREWWCMGTDNEELMNLAVRAGNMRLKSNFNLDGQIAATSNPANRWFELIATRRDLEEWGSSIHREEDGRVISESVSGEMENGALKSARRCGQISAELT